MSEVVTRWIRPLNWDGEYETTYQGNRRGWKRMTVQFIYYDTSDQGTEEDHVIKLARQDFIGDEGKPCWKIGITEIRFATYGLAVQLDYDMNPNQLICMIPQSDVGTIKGPFMPIIDTNYLAGETGDLLLTTIGASQYDSYNIQLDILIKEKPLRLGNTGTLDTG